MRRIRPKLHRVCCIMAAAMVPAALALGGAPPVSAEAMPAAKPALERYVHEHLPPDWQSRISFRDGALVIFATPPVARAFELLYDPAAQEEVARQACPPKADPIWSELAPAKDIAFVLTVLGKSGLRVGCTSLLATAPHS
jgi:hypothetical protein